MFASLTAWEDRAAMGWRTPAHLAAMNAFPTMATEHAVTVERDGIPTWDKALELLESAVGAEDAA